MNIIKVKVYYLGGTDGEIETVEFVVSKGYRRLRLVEGFRSLLNIRVPNLR